VAGDNVVARLIISTDEPVTQIGLQTLLAADPEFELVRACRSEELVATAVKHRPRLILCNIAADADLAVVQELHSIAPDAAVILWTRDFAAEFAKRAVDLGVRGFLSTTAGPETLRECLRTVARGEMWMEQSLSMALLRVRPVSLSRRQMQLVALLVQGLKNKEIATEMGISEGTVKAYLTTVFERVGARDRFELALFGLKNMRHLRDGGAEQDNLPAGRVPSIAPRIAVRRSVA
jgi:two-component system, NarL family, nitrate/nitrite response regulator NarL